MVKSKLSPDHRAPLTRDRVLRVAMDLADEGGIESLSMRKLGERLGVEAMSLYHHVANKEFILDGIADLAWSEVVLTPIGIQWSTAVRQSAVEVHEMFLRHPWACDLFNSHAGDSQMRYLNSMLGHLREAGFSSETAHHALHVLNGHILGFTSQILQVRVEAEEMAEMAESVLPGIPADEFPYLVEHIHEHVRESRAGDAPGFGFGLDLILDGLQRIRPVT